MIMGSGGSHWRPARKRRPYLKQLIKKTPIVGQLFKVNSKIASEPEVLVLCACFGFVLFTFKNFAKVIGSAGAELAPKRRLLHTEEWVKPHPTLAFGGCQNCILFFYLKIQSF